MSDPLVTVTAYSAGRDAELAKGVLDEEGIESLVDEAAERRVKVRVLNVDAIRAGDALTARFPAGSEIAEADESEPPAACPACASTEVGSSRRGRTFVFIAMISLAVGVGVQMTHGAFLLICATAVLLLITGRRRCLSCGEMWD